MKNGDDVSNDNFWETENVNTGIYFYDIELPEVMQRYSDTLHILR
jgi:hypothetical protein